MDLPLTALKGIGPKRAEAFERLGIRTAQDLLGHLPRDYQDFSRLLPCAGLREGLCAAMVRIDSQIRTAYPRKGLTIVTATGQDESGKVSLIWYNQPYRKQNLVPGAAYLVYGNVERFGRTMRFVNPAVEKAGEEEGGRAGGILPVYPLTAGLTQKAVRAAVRQALSLTDGKEDPLPIILREEFSLMGWSKAIHNVHFPQSIGALEGARRRLVMQDMLFFLLALELLGRERKKAGGRQFCTAGLLEAFEKKLPFLPTDGQRRVMEEIAADMAAPGAMNRMVQGDVGSGKTVVAFFALYIAAKNGVQGALMAPTEILARQHFEKAQELFSGEFRVELLVGGLPAAERKRRYERIAAGECEIVVGTHALLQEAVRFRELGVVVADEQHRFGVRQRAAIAQKAAAPDVLVMSATPIPRTLSMVLFGDVEASVIDTLPPGRKPVKTALVPAEKREDMYRYVARKAEAGEQTYIICPLIEQSETMEACSAEELFEQLQRGVLRHTPVELLHGRMDGAQKAAVIERFRTGETKVLVSTTVIEVGVDVPNATAIIIESADRFGLAQLHQLRGRVGRGDRPAHCFLLTDNHSKETLARLEVLCTCMDGFEIAKKDLEQRGPGEFLGMRQSGQSEQQLLTLADSIETLQEGQKMARTVLEEARYDSVREALFEQVRQAYAEKLRDIALN